MKARKFGGNRQVFGSTTVSDTQVRLSRETAKSSKVARIATPDVPSRKLTRGGNKSNVVDQTGQLRILKMRQGINRRIQEMRRPDDVPAFESSRRRTNPAHAGVYPSGRLSKQSAFNARATRNIPVSSMQVARPLVGRKLF